MRREALQRLEEHADKARALANLAEVGTGASSSHLELALTSVAHSLAGLIHANAEDERDTYERRTDRDRAFAEELRRLDSASACAVTTPAILRARRAMVIEALEDGLDAPPTEQDYAA